MDFFDRVTRTIAATGQDAIQKTRDYTDTARLTAQCNEEENKISNYHKRIGELYVSLHSDSYEPDFEELIQAIQVSKQKIQEWQSQIHNIKGTQICQNCGATVQKGIFFCTACGTKMPIVESAPEGRIICKKCGTKLEEGMKFCISCGSPVESLDTPAETIEEEKRNHESVMD